MPKVCRTVGEGCLDSSSGNNPVIAFAFSIIVIIVIISFGEFFCTVMSCIKL